MIFSDVYVSINAENPAAGFLHSVHGREERDPGEEWHRAPNEAGQGQVQVPHRPLIQLHGLYSELLVLLDTFSPCYSVMRSRGCGGGIQPTFDPPFCSVLLKLALTRTSPRPGSSPLTSTLFSETKEPSLASLTSPAESIYAVSSYIGGGGPGSIAISVKLVMVAHTSISSTRGMQ